MKILMASSEMAPFARTGGLGDVLEAFPLALAQQGHQVCVVLPFYQENPSIPGLTVRSTGVRFSVPVGDQKREAEIWEADFFDNRIQIFMIRCDSCFLRNGLYGEEEGDYPDNAERFLFFSKAVIELAVRMAPPPDVIHVHDWQTAMIPLFIKQKNLPFKTVLTIHNLAYQGNFDSSAFPFSNLPGNYFSPPGVEFYGRFNFLKSGILFSDAITTVSKHYAEEIQNEEFGCGLQQVLQEHAHKLSGVLNGADDHLWNPSADKMIPKKYNKESLSGKKTCKNKLLEKLGLEPNPTGPVFAMVTRLAEQKGFDILFPIIDRLLADDTRLIILGAGDTNYERELLIAQKKHRNRFSFSNTFDDTLAHEIQAGADIALLPSRFEPCGLSAIYSLKYGTVPIARACGGLHEIVQDYDPSTGNGNGFVFFEYSSEALWDSIRRARRYFKSKQEWQTLVKHVMGCNFSWNEAVKDYEKIYYNLLPQ